MTLRPQLPRMFAHDYIMWIDADCWVQDRAAVTTYFDLARKHDRKFVLVAELDVEYPLCVDAFDVRQERLRDLHTQLWDDTVAEQLYGKAPLNSGVFTASRFSPVWKAWEETVKEQYLENSKLAESTRLAHMAEQQSLNRVLHESQRFRLLTADTKSSDSCVNYSGLSGLPSREICSMFLPSPDPRSQPMSEMRISHSAGLLMGMPMVSMERML